MKFALALAISLISMAAQADWDQRSSTDKMTGKSNFYASLQSTNSLSLGFPYGGQNFGTLMVRKRATDGTTVMFTVGKGQILCSSYNGCPINVRFDDGPMVKFSGTEPADNSSDTVFINNEKRFIAMASKAKRILVQVNMFQNGAPILEFNTLKPLEWKPGK